MNRLRFYISVLKVEIKLGLKYRVDLLLSTTYLVFPMAIYFFVWKNIYGRGGQLGDYSMKAILTYYLVSLILYGTMPIFANYNTSESIRDGRLTYFLTKPMSHFNYSMLSVLGMTIVWLTANVIGMSIVVIAIRNHLIAPAFHNILWGIIFCLIGFAVAFMAGYMLNLSAFWFGEPKGITRLWDWAVAFAGGAIVPLDITPLTKIFDYLPFKYIYFVPAQVILGRISSEGCISELIRGLGWVIVLRILTRYIWLRGVRQYEAPGG